MATVLGLGIVMAVGGALWAEEASSAPESTQETLPRPIPAYVHNDYVYSRPPLLDALNHGFLGVEADYFVVNGELLVAHDFDRVDPERTLRKLYLDPLRERVKRYGAVYPGGPVFTLNIESKRSRMETYVALHDLLAEYEDMLTVVRDGTVRPGPVQVILVGWFPPLEWLAAQPVRYVAVQSHFSELPENHAEYPSHLLKLISQNYISLFRWHGEGPMPPEFCNKLAALVAAKRAVPGRILRIFHAPIHPAVYRAFVEAGVDRIGTMKNLDKARDLLLDIMADKDFVERRP